MPLCRECKNHPRNTEVLYTDFENLSAFSGASVTCPVWPANHIFDLWGLSLAPNNTCLLHFLKIIDFPCWLRREAVTTDVFISSGNLLTPLRLQPQAVV